MAGEEVLKLDITINADDPDDDVMKIVEKIRPRWRREDLKRKTLGEDSAMVNKMYAYYVTEMRDDAIVVRIFGDTYEEFSDRAREIKMSLLFSEVGISPEIHCLFRNGMCFAFVEGQTYTLKDRDVYSCKKLAKAVAKELARMHCKKTTDLAVNKYGFEKEAETSHEAARICFGVWGPELREVDPIVSSPDFPTKDMVLEEMNKIEKIVYAFDMPLVISHNDIHPGNAIYDPTKGTAVLVDYEYCFFNYQGWDLAQYLFLSAYGVGMQEETPELHSEEYKKDFLRAYLESLSVFDDWGRKVTDQDVDDLLVKANNFMMYVMLMQITISVLLATKPPENFGKDTNWCRAAHHAWKLYLITRKKILGI